MVRFSKRQSDKSRFITSLRGYEQASRLGLPNLPAMIFKPLSIALFHCPSWSDFRLFSSLLNSEMSFSSLSFCSVSMSIWSEAPAENSSTILNTRQSRKMTTMDPASSSTPFRQTSMMNPAKMIVASKQWNLDLKYLGRN